MDDYSADALGLKPVPPVYPDSVMARTSECSDVTLWIKVSSDGLYRCDCCNWVLPYGELMVLS
jgi:hypothetical protein